ncbi:cd7 antigen-like [Anableps anableps]
MTGIRYLACLWTAVITLTGFAFCGDVSFVERQEGESMLIRCHMEPRGKPPFGLYLRRSWLRPTEVFFKYTKNDASVNESFKDRVSVSGDPSDHSVNVTISQLRAADTDRYICEFMVEKVGSEDEKIQGNTEIFLQVSPDVPGSTDMDLIQTCTGGSAVLPCYTPNTEGLAVEGVILNRQRGRAPVEVAYHSQQHHSSLMPTEKVQLSSAPGPGGITFNVTLLQLQPEDSAIYSCQLLLRGRPNGRTSLRGQVFFISVQGDKCGCSSNPTLLYALSGAVGVLFLLLLVVGCVAVFKGKAQKSAKSHSQPPIYEEMIGVQSPTRKLASLRLEEVESSEYKNCPVKKASSGNHYESPSGALFPRRDA